MRETYIGVHRGCNAYVLGHGRFGLDRLPRFCEITHLVMKTRLWILICCLISATLSAQPTNLVDVLRQFQAELDAKAAGLPAPSPTNNTPTKPKPIPPTQPAPVTTVTPQTPQTTTPPSLPRLQPGDTLKIEVIGEPDMSADKLTVAPDGTIQLPIAGPIKIASQTIPEAIESIRACLAKDYLVDPKVRMWRTAIVEALAQSPTPNTKEIWPGVSPAASPNTPPAITDKTNPCSFTINDQVAKPGRYEWPANQTLRIHRAIGMAGGATSNANLAKAIIRRTSNGKTQDIPCDLRKIPWLSEDEIPILQNGDEIIIPRE